MNTLLRNELLRHLDDRTTGCLSVVARGGLLRLYVMNGEILASDSPEDEGQILRRTVAAGITDRTTAAALMRSAQDTPIAELLFETLPEPVAQRLIFDRFRENVGNYLAADSSAEFEPLPTIFHPNLQVGHDSRALLGQLEVVLARTRALRNGGFQLRLHPGTVETESEDARQLAEIVGAGRTVAQILRASPFEELHTLDRLALMLEDDELSTTEPSRAAPEVAPPAPVEPEVVAVDDSPGDVIEIGESTEAPMPRAAVAAAGMALQLHSYEEGADDEEGFDEDEDEDEHGDAPDVIEEPAPEQVDVDSAWLEVEEVTSEPAPPATIAASASAVPAAPPSAEDGGMFRVNARNPSGMAKDMPEADLSLFEDHDGGRGTNLFSYTGQEVADDRIDLNNRDEIALDPPSEERAGTGSVQLRTAGPALTNADARRKIEIVNEILRHMAAALDDKNGIGSGTATIQLLLEGSPGEFALIFRDVRAASDGSANADTILSNLRRRPPTEHRRLLNRALSDLVERGMNAAAEELDDDVLDEVLSAFAGYQQRLGL